MGFLKSVFILFLLGSSFFCSAQKQLVFLENGNVTLRFTEGDRFIFKMKSGDKKEGYILELSDFTLITSGLDTIPFLAIKKVALKWQHKSAPLRKIGSLLMAGGLGYIAIDQANVLFGSSKSGFDQSNQLALGLAGAGFLCTFIKPRYKRVSHGVVMRTVDYTSPYFRFNGN
jgi:hypothetical protein